MNIMQARGIISYRFVDGMGVRPNLNLCLCAHMRINKEKRGISFPFLRREAGFFLFFGDGEQPFVLAVAGNLQGFVEVCHHFFGVLRAVGVAHLVFVDDGESAFGGFDLIDAEIRTEFHRLSFDPELHAFVVRPEIDHEANDGSGDGDEEEDDEHDGQGKRRSAPLSDDEGDVDDQEEEGDDDEGYAKIEITTVFDFHTGLL